MSNDSYERIKAQLMNVTTRARSRFAGTFTVRIYDDPMNLVIVACLESNADKRNFMLAASENGMLTNEYVYIFIESSRAGFG